MLVIKQWMVPIDFNSIIFPTIEVDGDQQLFDSSEFFKIFCVQHKKETYTGFGWTLPLTILFEIIYLILRK